MQEKFSALQTNHTWQLCPRPWDKNVIKNKSVFKLKHETDGIVEKFKVRLVAKGFQHKDGLDYTETFSPIIKPVTIRIVLRLVVHFSWEIR